MATKREEPYVSVKEIVKKTPTVNSNSSTSNIAGVIVAPVGPRLAYVTSPVEFLRLYTVDGNTIPRNADITFINAYYLSYFSGLVIARSLNTNSLGGVIISDDGTETKSTPVIFKDDVMLNMSGALEFRVEVATANGVYKEPNWLFVMNNTVFYNYEDQSIYENYSQYTNFKYCQSLEDLAAVFENMDNIHASGSVDYDTVSTEGGDVTYKVYTLHLNFTQDEITYNVFEVRESSSISVSSLIEEVGTIIPDESQWLFTMVGDIPLNGNTNNITLDNYNNGTFDLTIKTRDGNDKYQVSLNPNAESTEGVNVFIEYLNTQEIGYKVTAYNNLTLTSLVPSQETPKPSLSVAFGDSGFNENDSKKESCIFEALDYLAEQEIYDIEYLAQFGLTSVNITRRFQIVGTANKWYCPIDVPYSCTTYSSVKRYVDNIIVSYGDSADSEEVPTGSVIGPFERNSSLTGWYNYIAPSTLYYERVMSNKKSSAEFAPVFKNDYGRMNYTNPTKLFKKNEREDLLSLTKPVNWAVYDQRSATYYMNDNRTYQLDQDNVVCEEQNARIVWKISKDVARILDQFIGKYNTRTTRAMVVDAISYYLDWNIMNKKFPPEDYLIQCDEYNNTDEIINANKLAVELKIRLYKAIKYVEVVNKVFPLGVDFSTSI